MGILDGAWHDVTEPGRYIWNKTKQAYDDARDKAFKHDQRDVDHHTVEAVTTYAKLQTEYTTYPDFYLNGDPINFVDTADVNRTVEGAKSGFNLSTKNLILKVAAAMRVQAGLRGLTVDSDEKPPADPSEFPGDDIIDKDPDWTEGEVIAIGAGVALVAFLVFRQL